MSEEVLHLGQLAVRKRGKLFKWRRVYCKLAQDENGSAFSAAKSLSTPVSTYLLLSRRSRVEEVDSEEPHAAMGGVGFMVAHRYGFTLSQGGHDSSDNAQLTLAAATADGRRKWLRALSHEISSLGESVRLAVEDVAAGHGQTLKRTASSSSDRGSSSSSSSSSSSNSSSSSSTSTSTSTSDRSGSSGRSDRIDREREHHRSQHIEVPLHTLAHHLGALVPTRHRADWQHFVALLTALYHQRYHAQIQELKAGFEHFAVKEGSKQQQQQRRRPIVHHGSGTGAGAGGHGVAAFSPAPAAAALHAMPRRERQALEHRFLSGLHEVLQKGNFEVMTDVHWYVVSLARDDTRAFSFCYSLTTRSLLYSFPLSLLYLL
jgi:hypothetical protein